MKTIALTAVASLLMAAPALAETPARYIQGSLGAAVGGEHDISLKNTKGLGIQPMAQRFETDGDVDGGAIASLLVGQKINAKWAVEGEVVYVASEAKLDDDYFDADATAYGLLLNVNYEALRSDKYAVYVGAGVGYGFAENKIVYSGDTYTLSDDDNGVMWQLKAGLTYDLSARSAVDVGYRYMAMPETPGVEIGDKYNSNIHALTVGLRYAL